MKLNYKNQLILTILIVILFNIMNTVFKHWVFTSIGYCLCGLLWVLHPVMLGNAEPTKKNLNWIRLAGGMLILIGLLTRSYLY